MKDKLNLTNVEAYEIIADIDERSSGSCGIYKNDILADRDAKGCGWYGSDGTVHSLDNIYSDGENIYQVKKLGGFKDELRQVKEELTESIKAKLSDAELEFIRTNPLR